MGAKPGRKSGKGGQVRKYTKDGITLTAKCVHETIGGSISTASSRCHKWEQRAEENLDLDWVFRPIDDSRKGANKNRKGTLHSQGLTVQRGDFTPPMTEEERKKAAMAESRKVTADKEYNAAYRRHFGLPPRPGRNRLREFLTEMRPQWEHESNMAINKSKKYVVDGTQV